MKYIINTIKTLLFISIISHIGYGEMELLKKSDNRVTKSYTNDLVAAKAYYEAALKGEFQGGESKKDAFLLSSMQFVNGWSCVHIGFYRAPDGDVWYVKKAQNPVHEYLGSKVMNLLIGPLSPEVMPLIDAPGYTASKLLSNFVRMGDMMNKDHSKPIIGESRLEVAMDLMGLGDRNIGNMGYVEVNGQLEAARVDFDASFEFFRRDIKGIIDGYEADKKRMESAIEDIYAIPDTLFLYVLGDAYKGLWEAGIAVDYEKYKYLGSILIANKYELSDPGQSLIKYVKEGNMDLVRILLEENGVDDSARLHLNNIALREAILNNNVDMFHLLIEKGADINTGHIGNSFLHIVQGIDMLHLLIENGADINSKDPGGSTMLHLTSRMEHCDIVRLLIKNGADINSKDNTGYTPLHLATSGDRIDIVRLLIENGVDINSKDNEGYTPLHLANRIDIACLLIENGANINSKDNEGYTPLHWAGFVGTRRIDIARLLIENGADIDAP